MTLRLSTRVLLVLSRGMCVLSAFHVSSDNYYKLFAMTIALHRLISCVYTSIIINILFGFST